MAVWFFFSYARQDWDDRLERFYKRLAKEIGRAKQLSESEAGFFDQRSIEIGDVWDSKLRDALRTARVLIAICSPTYFSREYCGKEVQVCIERVPAGAQSTAIIPVMWYRPSESQHPAISKYQLTHEDLTNIYATEGLYYIMGLKKHEDDYEEFVMKLSRKIVAAGEQRSLSQLSSLRPFAEIPNPFAAEDQSAGGELKNALFTYLAGQKHELPGEVAHRYGAEGKEWRPFHPGFSDPVGIMAQEVASRQKLFYKDLRLDAEIAKRVREAEDRKEIVILIVDPWSVQVKSYEQYMRSYDRENYENSAVLVVWNSTQETNDPRSKELRVKLDSAFKFHAGGRYYVDSICSHKNFRGTLAKTLAKLRNNLIQASAAYQGINAPELAERALRNGIDPSKQPMVTSPGEPPR